MAEEESLQRMSPRIRSVLRLTPSIADFREREEHHLPLQRLKVPWLCSATDYRIDGTQPVYQILGFSKHHGPLSCFQR